MTQTTRVDASKAGDRELKNKHRVMWALGNYPAVADEIIPELGPALVEACDVRPGQRVLDVAAGTGNAAVPAALTGAQVVATDLTPDLLDVGRRIAASRDAHLEWREADAEALPFADGEFDTVLSCVGVMFAPHHQVAADELVRVCRAGGTLGVLSWTPEGFVGQLFATMKPYLPPPPPGAQAPVLWGRSEHVRGLLGDRVTDISEHRRTVTVDRFGTPEEFRDYWKTCYGPTVAAYRGIAGDPDRTAALDQDLADLARRHDRGDGAMEWEYLLLTARRHDAGARPPADLGAAPTTPRG